MKEKKVGTILQARTGSTRLPGKVLKEIAGMTLLELQIRRLQKVAESQVLVVATTNKKEDDELAEHASSLGVKLFRGSEDDVLERYFLAAQQFDIGIVVRVTSDCPFIDPGLLDQMIRVMKQNLHLDFLTNNMPPSFPHGLNAELIRFGALKTAQEKCSSAQDREHVAGYIRDRPNVFKLKNYVNDQDPDGKLKLHKYRWTVDYPEDFEFAKKVIESMPYAPEEFKWQQVLSFLESRPELCEINKMHAH